MANPASVLPPVSDLHQRGLSITLPPPAAAASPELSPRSTVAAPAAPAPALQPADAAARRQSSCYSDHGARAEPDAPEETTPRTSFSSGSCTPPKQPLRRTSGRRPLSVLSSSSTNSDMSPLRAPIDASSHAEAPHAHHAPSSHAAPQGHHGLGVSYANHQRAVQQTPEPYSPSKHRRHRSMISAPIDYRTQYSTPQQFGHPLYVNYTPRPHTDPSASPHAGAYPPYSPFGSSFAPYSTGHFGQYGGSHSYGGHQYAGAYPTPGPSPLFDTSPIATTPPLGGPQSPGHSDPIQDLFVAMAYKERQVLEARQNLEEATEVLNAFKRQLKAMISPHQEPVTLPCRPTIISRRHCPNLGIHALAYTARRPRARSRGLQVVTWRVDNEVSQAMDDEMRDDDDDDDADELAVRRADGIALRIVKCLLGIVHCIIATLPVHQRDFARHPFSTPADAAHRLLWSAEYPLPMETLFGHLAYEP